MTFTLPDFGPPRDMLEMLKPDPLLNNAMLESIERVRDEHTSKGIFQHLVKTISDFEAGLDSDHEVAAMLASFGQAVTLHVTNVSFIYPKLIVFAGVMEDGNSATLVQHINQLSFLLAKVNRLAPETPRKPIGFGPWETVA